VAFVILILCSVLQSCWEAGQGLSMASLLHIGLEEVAEHVKQVNLSGNPASLYELTGVVVRRRRR